MADKKQKAIIEKAKNEMDKASKIIESNKLEFADKVYKILRKDFLDNDEMKNLINKLTDDTMSVYEVKYNKLIDDYEKFVRQSESLCLAVMDYVEPNGQVDFKKAKLISDRSDPFYQEIQKIKKQLKERL